MAWHGMAVAGWHVVVGTASSKATQRSAPQRNAAGRTIRREAGQRSRATRLPGESRDGSGGSGCKLTPSRGLGRSVSHCTVYHHPSPLQKSCCCCCH